MYLECKFRRDEFVLIPCATWTNPTQPTKRNSPKHALHRSNNGVGISIGDDDGNPWLGGTITGIFGVIKEVAKFML